MTLMDCLQYDPTEFVFEHDPDVLELKNALYIPKTSLEPDPEFGLYDELGRLVVSSALFHRFPTQLKGQRYSSVLTPAADYPEIESAIYGGAIGLHFGHFITECLNRLWYAAQERRSSEKILFHSSSTVETIFRVPWAADFMRLTGIRREDIIIPELPTIIRRIAVPGPAFGENHFGYRTFARFCNRIGDTAMSEATVGAEGPVYLSRARVRQGIMHVVNEHDVIEDLSRHGVTVLYPEEMTVADQIALFRRDGPVTGILGSAFHNSIFTHRPRGTAISLNLGISSNYSIMDAINDANIRYVYDEATERTDPPPGFFTSFRWPRPERVAGELLRLMDDRNRSTRSSGRQDDGVTSGADPLPPTFKSQKNATSFSPRPCQIISIDGQYFSAKKSNGSICSDLNFEREPSLLPVIALIQEDIALLITQNEHAPVLTMKDDPLVSPVLSYRLEQTDRGWALRHPQTRNYVALVPKHVGQPASCNREQIDTWELFRLNEIPRLDLNGRFGEVFDELERLWNGGSPNAAAKDVLSTSKRPFRSLISALRRVDRLGDRYHAG